eukprot:TRINITY_DN779817_c0_g1_i1.p1 TRINITY_DN779817_c0_g1~~TRINITY_DN779817_c0_g1_i1.p1  ORF type:complete len:294 (-),score=70.42 TRINITY_DN779817_c0_g1_i1:189-1070(-)
MNKTGAILGSLTLGSALAAKVIYNRYFSSHPTSHVVKPTSEPPSEDESDDVSSDKLVTRSPKQYRLPSESVYIIGVAGASGSGKTTVCDKLLSQLPAKRICIISIDNYYKSLPEGTNAAEYNFDDPKALDFALLAKHLKLLREGQTVEIPQYDFCTHSRTDKTTSIGNVDVIIVDGIFALHVESLRALYDISVFAVECEDVCLIRRIRRDTVERGRSLKSILGQYEKFVKPAFENYIRPSMNYADIIVPRAAVNKVAIRLLVREISHRIKERDSRSKMITARADRKRASTFDG